MIENEDYELIPSHGTQNENTDVWSIRILKGPFIETVIEFDTLTLDEEKEELKFNFNLISSPDPDLKEENIDLQATAASILYSILDGALEMAATKNVQ